MRAGWKTGIGLLLVCTGALEAGELRGKVEVRTHVSSPEGNPGMAYGHGGMFEKPEPKPAFTEAQSVIIYVEGRDSVSHAPPQSHPQMVQRAKTFIPPVLPVLIGTTVDFPNEDKIYHNVFSYSKPKKFDLGRYPTGSSKSVMFDKPGLVKVFCEIHKDMVAYVLVLETPFFAVPNPAGDFDLPDLPVGQYRVHIWHPALPPQVQDVFVPKSGAVEVNFIL